MKYQVRILGLDDAPHVKTQKQVLVLGTVFRGGEYMDGLLSTTVEKDGFDATEKLIGLINKSRNIGQLSYLMLDGITFAGFNVVDISKLFEETGLPVIAVIRKKPDFKAIEKALNNLPNKKERLMLIKLAGPVYEFSVEHSQLKEEGKIYFQVAGLDESEAEKVLKLTTLHSLVPEPLRIAHIIGSGLEFGESKGRA